MQEYEKELEKEKNQAPERLMQAVERLLNDTRVCVVDFLSALLLIMV